MNVKEMYDYQFWSPFKNVSRQNVHDEQFQCLNLNTLFSIKGRKCM